MQTIFIFAYPSFSQFYNLLKWSCVYKLNKPKWPSQGRPAESPERRQRLNVHLNIPKLASNSERIVYNFILFISWNRRANERNKNFTSFYNNFNSKNVRLFPLFVFNKIASPRSVAYSRSNYSSCWIRSLFSIGFLECGTRSRAFNLPIVFLVWGTN